MLLVIMLILFIAQDLGAVNIIVCGGIHSIPSVGVVALTFKQHKLTRGAVCCLDLPFGERL